MEYRCKKCGYEAEVGLGLDDPIKWEETERDWARPNLCDDCNTEIETQKMLRKGYVVQDCMWVKKGELK